MISDECRKYLSAAATKLDCAVQLCGDPDLAKELAAMERRLDELAAPSGGAGTSPDRRLPATADSAAVSDPWPAADVAPPAPPEGDGPLPEQLFPVAALTRRRIPLPVVLPRRLAVDYTCPGCGYGWGSNPKPTGAEMAEAFEGAPPEVEQSVLDMEGTEGHDVETAYRCPRCGHAWSGNEGAQDEIPQSPDASRDLVDWPLYADGDSKPPYEVPSMAWVDEMRGAATGDPRLVSTFSGGGGSCLGFEMEGYRVLWANEFVPAAQDTYMANHPDVPLCVQDVREVDPNLILEYLGLKPGELEVFEGSPPCASFSTAGKKSAGWGQVRKYSDVEQRTDDLFTQFIRLLIGLKPKVFVAENVAGLTMGVARGYFNETQAALEEAGYVVEARILDASWLGVPQMRRRTIFVGVREDLGVRPAWPRYETWQYTLREALNLGRATRLPSRRHGTDYDDRTPDEPAPTVQAGEGLGGAFRDWDVEEQVEAGHQTDHLVEVKGKGGCSNCGQPVDRHCEAHLIPCCPGKCPGMDKLRRPTRVIHDTSGERSLGDVTDQPSPTITSGVGGLNANHFQIEEEVVECICRGHAGDGPNEGCPVHGDLEHDPVLIVRDPDGGYEERSLDEPLPTVQAYGVGNVREYQMGLGGAGEPDEDTSLDRYAIGREWDELEPGEKSSKYLNLIKPDEERPSPTVTQTGGNMGAASVTHPTERRKFTIQELKAVCAFPEDFVLTGTYRQQWERLGRAVPPLMMRAVARAVREGVLEKVDG